MKYNAEHEMMKDIINHFNKNDILSLDEFADILDKYLRDGKK
jgi:hypothetical protein